MAGESLTNDVAWMTAIHIVVVIGGCLREDEKREAFDEVYAYVKADLECLQIQENRMQRWMKPSRN